jgi:hypothetical protein
LKDRTAGVDDSIELARIASADQVQAMEREQRDVQEEAKERHDEERDGPFDVLIQLQKFDF